MILPLGEPADVAERLAGAGLEVSYQLGQVLIDYVAYDSPAYRRQPEYGWAISGLQVAAQRLSRYWFCLPVMVLPGWVAVGQRRRRPQA